MDQLIPLHKPNKNSEEWEDDGLGNSSNQTPYKSTVWNTVDYSGQEKLFWKKKHICVDRSGLCDGPSATLGWASDRNSAKTYVNTTDRLKEKQAPSETKRGPSGLRRGPSDRCKTRKNPPKVTGSVKFIFSVLADRTGARSDRPRLLYLTSDDALNAL
jgi:hypothetical protein